MEMPGRKWIYSDYRQAFNGNEKTDEIYSGGYDFGARQEDSRIGRFWSVDPKTKKYPSWSPYLFAANSPIKFKDINGEGPGDKFASVDEAAIDFGKSYNDNSINVNKEYGSTIYKVTTDKETYYTYSVPNVGKAEGLPKGPSKNPKGTEKVAEVHTHGAYKADFDHTQADPKSREAKLMGTKDENNEFSQDDEQRARSQKKPSYVATPSGELKKFDPKKHDDYESDTISKDLPSDKNSPNRVNKNNSDEPSLPKNEPTTEKIKQ